jgi:hypothetical protein
MLLSIKLKIITKNNSNLVSVAGGGSNLKSNEATVLRKNWQNWHRNSYRGDFQRNWHPIVKSSNLDIVQK